MPVVAPAIGRGRDSGLGPREVLDLERGLPHAGDARRRGYIPAIPAVLAELAYRSSAQALLQQEAALNELRSRTGTLLAANAVTASFLGAVALKGGRLDTAAGLAVACFALSLGAALFILLPRGYGLRFSISGPVLYEALYACGDDAEEIHRRTAYWLEEFWSANQVTIDGLYPWFTVAAVALALELVLWAVDLTGIL